MHPWDARSRVQGIVRIQWLSSINFQSHCSSNVLYYKQCQIVHSLYDIFIVQFEHQNHSFFFYDVQLPVSDAKLDHPFKASSTSLITLPSFIVMPSEDVTFHASYHVHLCCTCIDSRLSLFRLISLFHLSALESLMSSMYTKWLTVVAVVSLSTTCYFKVARELILRKRLGVREFVVRFLPFV